MKDNIITELSKATKTRFCKGDVSGSIYGELGKFINKSDERIFNDRLMILTCIEISINRSND